MAATDSIPNPVKGQALRLYGCIKNVTTGKVITGGLTGLASIISKDGGATASTTTAATEIGTTGLWYLDLTTTETNADTIVVKVSATNTNATDAVLVVPMADLALTTSNAWNQSVKRLEQFLIQSHGLLGCELRNNGTTLTLRLPVGSGDWLTAGIDPGPDGQRDMFD